jgi:RNA polymerase sigma-70 factor (ECF subfamily)
LPGDGSGRIEAAADVSRVLRAVGRLPAEQRAVLSLFALEGLRHGEIAEILGIPEGTVWSRLHMARNEQPGHVVWGILGHSPMHEKAAP